MKNSFLAATGLMALTMANAAHAQSAAAPVAGTADVSAAAPQSTGVEDIVVTAQRRSERLQNVPVAVTAVTSAKLVASGITNTQDLTMVTPGLTSPQTQGYSQPHIRGIGATTNGPGLEQSVATYIDGVYIAAAPSALLSLNNVDRIEVLKGPQGTLFGRNATGGLIQVVTRDPASHPTADFSVGYARFRDVTADAYVAGPISDTLRADIAAHYETQQDGWGTNLANGDAVGSLPHDFAGRIKLLWEPDDNTKIRLAADYEDRESHREVAKLLYSYPSKLPANALLFGPFAQGGKYDTNRDTTGRTTLSGGGVSLQGEHRFGDVTLQSITAYRDARSTFLIDSDGVPVALSILDGHARDRQFSQELQLASSASSKLKWVAGLYYFRANDQYVPIDLDRPAANQIIRTVDKQLTNAGAAYAQATYEFLENTNLTLGGRYNYEKKELSGQSSVLNLATGALLGTPASIPPAGSTLDPTTSFKRFNYRVALDHKFTPDIMAYVSYNTGFKSGGYNLNNAANPSYLPEDLKALEAGLKMELFDRHLRLNTAAYYYWYKNIQIGRYRDIGLALSNGPAARLYGVDVDAELVVTRGLNLSGGFSYNHTQFTDFPSADYIVPCGGATVVPNPGVLTCSATGNKLPYGPEFTFNLGGTYSVETAAGKLAANVTYFHTSTFYVAPDNVLRQTPYGLLNISLSWTEPSGHASVKVWGKNLTNSYYFQSGTETNTSIGVYNAAPRTYGVTLGYKF